MNNLSIRKHAKENRIPFWLIANELKISESSFTRLMRKELDTITQEKITKIIDDITSSRKEA